MCVDLTNLNKSCPWDCFPILYIDQLVDGMAGHKMLSFMDAFSCYNQIWMHVLDENVATFTTIRGVYCYKVMPFSLKNAGATYQQLVNMIFQK